MRFQSIQLINGKHPSGNTKISVTLLSFALILIMSPFFLMKYPHQSSSPKIYPSNLNLNLNHTDIKGYCNIFSGEWVPYSKGPYYYNETCHYLIDQQNCIKFGRPDRDFLKWRWQPYECELPPFDATHFLKLVRGKSMAFLGDSVGRNQMNSLLCLLNQVSKIDQSHIFSF